MKSALIKTAAVAGRRFGSMDCRIKSGNDSQV
jgi:hypothetical protein